jgi:hypothetical protein
LAEWMRLHAHRAAEVQTVEIISPEVQAARDAARPFRMPARADGQFDPLEA